MSVSKKQQQKKPRNAPITTKITSDFTFHICYSCSFSPWYLSIFLLFLCGVVNGWDYHHYYNCGVIDIAIRHSWSSNQTQLDDQQLLVFQEPEVSPELCPVVVNDLHQTSNPYVAQTYCRLSQSLSCSSQCTLSKLASYILPLSAELPLGHLCTPYNSGSVSCDGLCLYAFEAQGLLLLLYHDRLFIISLIKEYYLDKEYVNSRQLTLINVNSHNILQ